jgi:hypothetical protein
MEIQFERVKIHGRCVNARETNSQKSAQSQAEGKAPSTKAGEFVRGEIEHVRRGKHGARSTNQAIAIAYPSAARRGEAPAARQREDVGIDQEESRRERQTRRSAKKKAVSKKRLRESLKTLRREGRRAASKRSLSRAAKNAR